MIDVEILIIIIPLVIITAFFLERMEKHNIK